jgi:hypothetical protein
VLLLLGSFCLLSQAGQPARRDITLEWELPTSLADGTALTNLTECRVYMRREGEEYDFANPLLTVPAATNAPVAGSTGTATVTNLSPGPHYFTVTAVTAEGEESNPSSELSYGRRVGTVVILSGRGPPAAPQDE